MLLELKPHLMHLIICKTHQVYFSFIHNGDNDCKWLYICLPLYLTFVRVPDTN